MVNQKITAGKRRWHLAPLELFVPIVDVIEYGAGKYEPDNWRLFDPEDARKFYGDALVRHLDRWQRGEITDPESGLPHLAHAACCAVFLLWYQRGMK